MRKSILLFVLLITLIAAFLRLYKLNQIPISLNRDELAIGYNAYSLLTTGKDEWGQVFPLALRSFGDWKLPVYPDITMLSIKLLGLNTVAVRLPGAFAGIMNVILIYLVAFYLFRNRKIAILAMFFMAVSPWGIFFSRIAIEANLALTFLLLGFFLFLFWLENQNLRYLFFSSILFGLTLFTYHGYDVFMPLFALVLLIIYHKPILKNKRNLFPIALFLCFFAAFSLSSLHTSVGKLQESIFNDPNAIYNRADKFRNDGASDPLIVQKLLYNKFAAIPYQVAQNYLLSYSPDFLFDKNGIKIFYTLEGFGFLYIFDSVLIISGLTLLIWNHKRQLYLLGAWVLIAPIPLAITRDVLDPVRLLDVYPAFILIESYCVYTIFDYVIRKKQLIYKVMAAFAALLFCLNVIYFLDFYFAHMNIHSALFFGYDNYIAAQFALAHPQNKIVMVGQDTFPYIDFLFYEKYNPNAFRRTVKYYAPTPDGFYYVKSYGRYTFVPSIDRKYLQPGILYIDHVTQYDKTHLLRLPSGQPVFTILQE